MSYLTTGIFVNYSRNTKKMICIFFHLDAFIRRLCHYVTQLHRSVRKIGDAREERKRRNVNEEMSNVPRGALARSKAPDKQYRGLFLHHCHYSVNNNSETISLSLTFFSWKARLCGAH